MLAMLTKLLLALRDDAHRVEIVTVNGETRPQLGQSRTEDSERRADVSRQWGMPVRSPRQAAPATIDEPLPQRSQTVLSHRLPPALRQPINHGTAVSGDAGRGAATAINIALQRSED
jgi:hypothetical protein